MNYNHRTRKKLRRKRKASPLEQWPFNDAGAMSRINHGLEQLERGDGVYIGSFAEFSGETTRG